MNIDEAKLVSFVTSLMDEEMNEYAIERLFDLVKACYPVTVEAKPFKVDLKPLFDAMLNNRKIDAIKEYRQLTGECLKYAHADVIGFMNRIRGE